MTPDQLQQELEKLAKEARTSSQAFENPELDRLQKSLTIEAQRLEEVDITDSVEDLPGSNMSEE